MYTRFNLESTVREEIDASMDKKTESLKVTGWFCLGFAILIEASAVFFMATGKNVSPMILVIGLCLATVGIVNLTASRKRSG